MRKNLLKLISAPNSKLTTATVMLTDAITLLLSFGLINYIGSFLHSPTETNFYTQPWQVIILFILTYACSGLYPGVGIRPHEELKRLIIYTSLVHLALIASAFLLRDLSTQSRGSMLSIWIVSLVFVPLGRTLIRESFSSRTWWGVPVMILGAGEKARNLANSLLSQPNIGFKPVVLVDNDYELQNDYLGIPIVGPLSIASKLAQKMKVRHGILCVPNMNQIELSDLLQTHNITFPYLILIPSLLESLNLWVTARDVGGVMGLEIKHNLLFPSSQFVKRVLDIGLTIFAIIAISPLLILIALLIKLDSSGPILFSQERLGINVSRFKALKFRSMYVDAEEKLQELLLSDRKLKEEYEVFHKLRNDPRVTPFGKILRKFSLDELPQLWNVLIGEMSLVGPRAYMPKESAEMKGSEAIILRVLPGITGLWQVRGRNKFSFDQRLEIDIYYVRNWSLSLDLYLLASTFRVVLTSKGAY